MNNKIRCPYCGDEWTYNFIVDHESGKAIVTEDFHIIESWQECTCYKCFNKYRPVIGEATFNMWDFVYQAWRHVKGK